MFPCCERVSAFAACLASSDDVRPLRTNGDAALDAILRAVSLAALVLCGLLVMVT